MPILDTTRERPMTDDEARVYRRERNVEILERYRRGVAYGVVACVLVAGVAAGQSDAASARAIAFAGAFGGLALAISHPLTCLGFFASRAIRLVAPTGLAVAAAASLIAARTGGFESLATSAITVTWVYGSLVAPMRTRDSVIAYTLQLVLATILIAVLAPHPGRPYMFLALNISSALFLTIGIVLRERQSERTFIVQRRLDEANVALSAGNAAIAAQGSALAELNAELERRVASQVAEITRRAGEVEVLNRQLQERVVERSRELAIALARLSRGDDAPPAPMGKVLDDRIEILRPIGKGAMGEVYEALDRASGALVAVKLIHSRRAGELRNVQRFLGEARAAAAVSHPGIARTLHVDVTAEGTFFQTMELLRGVTMSGWLAEPGRRAIDAVAKVGHVIAGALAAAHDLGIVHRDVKPANIMLIAEAPGAKVLDFGVSKIATENGSDGLIGESIAIVGTPAYMAPEQVLDPRGATGAADVYALGVVLYEALAGEPPFSSESIRDLLLAHTERVPPDLRTRRHDVPAVIADLVMRSLAKKPGARPSARDVEAVLASHAGARNDGPVDAVARALMGPSSAARVLVSETGATELDHATPASRQP